MDANGRKYVENDLVYKITGCAMAVLNELGHGLREKTYERALGIEFQRQNMAYDSQHVHRVLYRGEHIDDYIPDLEVEGRVIVEVKTVDIITDDHIGQVINYLRITGCEAGVILNFKHSKLHWKKVVLSGEAKP